MGFALLTPLLIAGSAAEVYSRIETNAATKSALRQRMLEERVAANNRTIQRQRQLEEVVSRQNAESGVRGIDPASATFKAIQQDTFDQYAKDQKADNLSLQFKQEQIGAEMKASDESMWLGSIGDILGTATSVSYSHAFDSGTTVKSAAQKKSLLDFSSLGGIF